MEGGISVRSQLAVLGLLMSGMAWADASAVQASMPALESSAPLAVPAAPVVAIPVEPKPAPVVEPALGSVPFRVDYRCAGAQQISVLYPAYADADSQPIRLRWKGYKYRLSLAVSGSGARYASSQLVWWTKGDSAFLSTRGGRMLVRQCVAQPN
ncbi:hypothetical protein EHS17_11065 [Rhodobacteraceae bacterium CH30]|nr:hypothetical protein EHS17_11065 [Rhodobacteraceae bacterium CH30]